MRAKYLRRWVSCGAIAAIAFGQFAIAFHACAVQAATPVVASITAAHHGTQPCADMDMDGAPSDAQGDACVAHCSNGIVTAAQSDLTAAGLAALPAPVFIVVQARPSDASPGAAPVAFSRSPPLTLQFCRLLI